MILLVWCRTWKYEFLNKEVFKYKKTCSIVIMHLNGELLSFCIPHLSSNRGSAIVREQHPLWTELEAESVQLSLSFLGNPCYALLCFPAPHPLNGHLRKKTGSDTFRKTNWPSHLSLRLMGFKTTHLKEIRSMWYKEKSFSRAKDIRQNPSSASGSFSILRGFVEK